MKINFLEQTKEQKFKKRWKGTKFFAAFSILTLLFFYQLIFVRNFTKPSIPTPSDLIPTPSKINQWLENKFNTLNQVGLLLRSRDKLLKGEEKDRINILLLGMGGEGHEGTYLTDTIILLSIKPSIKKVALISIPRDLLVLIPGYGWRKINNANAFGEVKNPGNGGEFASQVVAQNFNIPIHYYIRVDFEGFKKIIDDVGGIGVYVERSFTDYQYPTDDFKYQVVSFKEGWQVMDGETALKFVRSRHGTSGEGSDFARSKRQQKVILALKEKILSLKTLLNPQKLQSIVNNFEKSVKTNLELWEILKLANIAREIENQNIIHKVIDDSPDSFLYATNIGGAYVLQPKSGNFNEIQNFIQNVFSLPEQNQNNSNLKKLPTKIEILNGTKRTGLAASVARELEKFNYNIVKIGNAPDQNYQKTVIYSLNGRQKLDDLAFLKEKLDADISLDIPSWLQNPVTPNKITILDKTINSTNFETDFLIILGQNARYFKN